MVQVPCTRVNKFPHWDPEIARHHILTNVWSITVLWCFSMDQKQLSQQINNLSYSGPSYRTPLHEYKYRGAESGKRHSASTATIKTPPFPNEPQCHSSFLQLSVSLADSIVSWRVTIANTPFKPQGPPHLHFSADRRQVSALIFSTSDATTSSHICTKSKENVVRCSASNSPFHHGYQNR